MSHKCTCDWCPAYREDLDAQTKGYDRALAELAEARAENERLRAALTLHKCWLWNAIELAEEGWTQVDEYFQKKWRGMERIAELREALARPTGGPRDE